MLYCMPMPLLILGLTDELLFRNEGIPKHPLLIHIITFLFPPSYVCTQLSNQGNNCIEVTTKML